MNNEVKRRVIQTGFQRAHDRFEYCSQMGYFIRGDMFIMGGMFFGDNPGLERISGGERFKRHKGLVFHYYSLGGGDLFAPRSRKISKSFNNFSIEKIENNIHETDLDRFIRKAVEEKKFVLAIRLYYLAIIKELSLSKMIKWKRDKTNRNYLNEIRSTSLFNPFKEVTRIFERVWYGQGNLDEKEYLSIKPKFDQLIKATQAATPTIEID